MLTGLFAHLYIETLPYEEAVAVAATAATTRWAPTYPTVAAVSGLLVLVFLGIRSYLREASEERWRVLALPFIVMGSSLFAVLPGMEFVPLAAAEADAEREVSCNGEVP